MKKHISGVVVIGMILILSGCVVDTGNQETPQKDPQTTSPDTSSSPDASQPPPTTQDPAPSFTDVSSNDDIPDNGPLVDVDDSIIQDKQNNSPSINTATLPDAFTDIQYTQKLDVIDPENDPIQLDIFSSPPGITISGLNLTWLPAQESVGSHEITLQVTDTHGNTSSKTLTILVILTNHPPVISNLADVTVNEGDTVTLSPTVFDSDGDLVEVSITGWMNSTSKQTNFNDAGVHMVTVTANDGKSSTVRSIQIEVINVNRAPVFDVQPSTLTMEEGEHLEVQFRASDPDGDPISFSVRNLPASGFTSSFSEEGLLTLAARLNGDTGIGATGAFEFTVTVADSGAPSLSDDLLIRLTVDDRWTNVSSFIPGQTCGCDPKVHAGVVVYCKSTGGSNSSRVYKNISGVETEISTSPMSVSCPVTHNGRAVWSGSDGQVYFHSGLATGVRGTGISPDLYNDEVVWQDTSRGFGDNIEISYFKSGITTTLTSDSYIDFEPRVYNGRVVWLKQVAPSGTSQNYLYHEVYYYDGATVSRLTNDSTEDLNPSIGPNIVSWVAYGQGFVTDREIVRFDGTQITRLTNDDVRDDGPFVDVDDSIVWYRSRGEGGIKKYSGGEILALTNAGEQDINPVSRNGLTVWRRSDQTHWKIMAHKGNKIYELSSTGFSGDPSTDGTIVVWRDQISGSLFMTSLLGD